MSYHHPIPHNSFLPKKKSSPRRGPSFLATLCLGLGLLLVGACSKPTYKLSRSENTGIITPVDGLAKASDDGQDHAFFLEERQVSYAYSVRLLVRSPDSLLKKIIPLAEAYDGYVQRSDKSNLVLMVKSNQAEGLIRQLDQLGKVQNKEIRSEDVSVKTMDYSIRLENAQKTRDRYLELLDMAQNVEEILTIEKELERLNTVIELLKGQLAYLQNRVSMSQIDIRIQKRTKPGPLGYVFVGLYEGIKWIFVRE